MMEEDLERTSAADPYAEMGGYVQRRRGMRLYAKPETPAGQRANRRFVEQRPADPERGHPHGHPRHGAGSRQNVWPVGGGTRTSTPSKRRAGHVGARTGIGPSFARRVVAVWR